MPKHVSKCIFILNWSSSNRKSNFRYVILSASAIIPVNAMVTSRVTDTLYLNEVCFKLISFWLIRRKDWLKVHMKTRRS